MKVKATSIFKWLNQQTKRVILLRGGAGSSKSYSVAQYLLMKAYSEPNKHILILRKTFPSLRISCIPLIIQLLNEYKLPYEYNKTEHTINLPNSSIITFTSLDNPDKIKSLTFCNYIWMEEATEFNIQDFRQLNLRMRAQNDRPNQMFLSFNPISKLNWVYSELIEPKNIDYNMHISTYKDNPFLDKEYVKQIEDLINQDKTYYDVYALGKWGAVDHVIYNNYETTSETPEVYDEIIYGVDFGYNDPSTVVKIYIKDQQYYLEELLYESKLTNNDLIQKLKSFNIKHEEPIYADSAEPARIEEIYKNGFNIYPAIKDKNSVKDGIDFVKRHHLFIHKNSTNLIREISGYKWKEDKEGNVLDEPVKFKDHLMDAMRYAIYTHEIQRGGTTEFFIG